ncbi:hypothetical protein [Roseateles noduli]|uniref:hypothetical protein n=1 Tax=Roseateles noduli TaxID=2052484 RepID=UPI003D658FEE
MNKFNAEAEDLMRVSGAEAAAVIVVSSLRGSGCSFAVHPMNDTPDYRLKLADALEMLAGMVRARATGGRRPQGFAN